MDRRDDHEVIHATGRGRLLDLCRRERGEVLAAWNAGIAALPSFAEVSSEEIGRNTARCLDAYVILLAGQGPEALDAFARDLADLRFRAGFEIHAPLAAASKFFDGVAAALIPSPLGAVERDAVWQAAAELTEAFHERFATFFSARMLQASENRFREISEEASDAIVIFDREGRILDTNRAFEGTLGVRREDWIGRPWWELVDDGPGERERAHAAQEQVLGGEPCRELLLRMRALDGSVRRIQISGHLALTRTDLRGVWILRDVTAEHIRRAQVLQTEKLASIGQLAASMTHELNNPLTWVMGNVQQALDETALLSGPRIGTLVEMLEDAMRGIRRIADIIRDLRGFVAGRDRAWIRFRVDEMLDLAMRIAGVQILSRAQITQDIAQIPPAVGHPGRLSQVVINLMINAVQAMGERPARDNRLWIRARPSEDGASYVVEIEDNGPGIPEPVLQRLFEPFVTTKEEGGMGLGLWVCREIVQEHGGTIDVQTSAGGTRFILDLPLHPEREDGPQPAGSSEPARVEETSGVVLLVDDEPLVLRLLSRQLAEAFEVLTAESGERALEILAAHEGGVDAVVCDVGLPGIDGFEVLARIRARWPELAPKVALMSGVHSFGEEAERVPCLQKPFSRVELRAVVERLVRHPPRG